MKRTVLILVFLSGIHALCQTKNSYKLIDALVVMPDPGEVYYDDGAGDGSILRAGEHKDYILTKPLKQVQDVVALKDKSIPVLIDCLTDSRPTQVAFSPSRWAAPKLGTIHVPVAFVCLDILSSTVNRHPKVFDPEISCDGMGCDYNRGFYFKPEVIEVHGPKSGLAIMRDVQSHWRRAHNERWIHWTYPEIWSVELRTAPE